jgi:DNA-binding response OmpR family regulator
MGKGSTFLFTLPVVPVLSDDPAQFGVKTVDRDKLMRQLKAHLGAPPNGKLDRKTVLVIDDDSHIRELLHQELESDGYHVLEAGDGREALRQVERELPDLVILDVMMPEMNGFEVAAALRNDPQTLQVPIIMLSIIQDAQRGARVGVDRYLPKPMDTQVLLGEIASLLKQGVSRNQVLLIEEDLSASGLLAEALQAAGYEVSSAASVGEGVSQAAAHRVDLVIANALLAHAHELVRTLRLTHGLENTYVLLYQ